MVSLLEERKTGRKRVVDENIRNLILEMYWNRNMGLRKIASSAGISTMTVWREVNRIMPEEIYQKISAMRGE